MHNFIKPRIKHKMTAEKSNERPRIDFFLLPAVGWLVGGCLDNYINTQHFNFVFVSQRKHKHGFLIRF